MSEDWRRDIAFSDRIDKTTAIADAYKRAHPEDTDGAVAFGRKAETQARKQATSLAEYQTACADALSELEKLSAERSWDPCSTDEHIFPNLPEHGATIGLYTNAQHYRDGLFSEVFVARHHKDGSTIALKITILGMMTAPHDSKREARILGRLRERGSSPNIVELLDSFSDAHSRFILVFPFMPYDLTALLIEGALPRNAQRTMIRDLFNGLRHLHHNKIIHRDIKPSNILLKSPTGPAYLADFGIAWSAEDPASEPANEKMLEVGTTCYRPPELLFGFQQYGSALDLWAAGCVVAQIVSLGSRTLFDAGDLGSELALIKSILETLGTPDLSTWPEAAQLPDWGKMRFVDYPAQSWQDLLPNCQPQALDLVSKLIRYESCERLTADDALQHPFLQS